MPMRATTIRFAEDLWDLLEAEASSQGISTAQFVRDAALLRLGAISEQRGDALATTTLEDLAAAAVARRDPATEGVDHPRSCATPRASRRSAAPASSTPPRRRRTTG